MAICYDGYTGRRYYCNSGWSSWGRWVLLGVVIVAFILFAFLFSCISARRRRKLGRQPIYGTGWAAAGNPNNQSYNPGYNQQQPQQYNYNQEQPQGGYHGQSQAYFGGQQTGVEMPNKTYQPPAGPPPGKY